MSFKLGIHMSVESEGIKPLHEGFGFSAEEILRRREKDFLIEKKSVSIESPAKALNLHEETIAQVDHFGAPQVSIPDSPPIKTPSRLLDNSVSSKAFIQEEEAKIFRNESEVSGTYYVNPFFAFLAWTVDALLGFCFLIISLCINYVFMPKGFFELSPTLASYLSLFSLNISVIYTFIFSLQVWFLMAIMVFPFQYTVLGFEGSTLGRWLFGISIRNSKNKSLKVSEKTKICAAISESLLLGGILSFIFIVLFPSRVPIFFWMRYCSKK